MSDSITCPKCRNEIPLTEAISHQVEERLRLEFEQTQCTMESEHAQALADSEAEERELQLLKEKRVLQDEREALELEVERKIEAERTKIVSATTERLEDA